MENTTPPAPVLKNAAPRPLGKAVSRIADAALHLTPYQFWTVARLARDAGLSTSSVSRVLAGRQSPSFLLVARLTGAVERAAGRKIDPRELVAEDGAFATRHVCELMGCSGCLPENALDEFGDTKAAFEGVGIGEWVTSRHPRGYERTEPTKTAAKSAKEA